MPNNGVFDMGECKFDKLWRERFARRGKRGKAPGKSILFFSAYRERKR